MHAAGIRICAAAYTMRSPVHAAATVLHQHFEDGFFHQLRPIDRNARLVSVFGEASDKRTRGHDDGSRCSTIEKHVVGLFVERLGLKGVHKLNVDALLPFKHHLHIDVATMGLEAAILEHARIVGACVHKQHVAVYFIAPRLKQRQIVLLRICEGATYALVSDFVAIGLVEMSENHGINVFLLGQKFTGGRIEPIKQGRGSIGGIRPGEQVCFDFRLGAARTYNKLAPALQG